MGSGSRKMCIRDRAESAEMYEYSPTTPGIRQAVYDELKYMEGIRPASNVLEKQQERTKLPGDCLLYTSRCV